MLTQYTQFILCLQHLPTSLFYTPTVYYRHLTFFLILCSHPHLLTPIRFCAMSYSQYASLISVAPNNSTPPTDPNISSNSGKVRPSVTFNTDNRWLGSSGSRCCSGLNVNGTVFFPVPNVICNQSLLSFHLARWSTFPNSV